MPSEIGCYYRKQIPKNDENGCSFFWIFCEILMLSN